MADAPSARGSSFLSNSTGAGHRIDTERLLHHPRYERGEGPEIKKKVFWAAKVMLRCSMATCAPLSTNTRGAKPHTAEEGVKKTPHPWTNHTHRRARVPSDGDEHPHPRTAHTPPPPPPPRHPRTPRGAAPPKQGGRAGRALPLRSTGRFPVEHPLPPTRGRGERGCRRAGCRKPTPCKPPFRG